MKNPLISSVGLAVLAGISLVTPAFAVVSMSWTSIGNAGNAADTTGYGAVGYGAVGYAYNIGTYEVTNAQYVDFLNFKGVSNAAGIYNATMGSNSNIVQNGSSGSYSYSVSSTYAKWVLERVESFPKSQPH